MKWPRALTARRTKASALLLGTLVFLAWPRVLAEYYYLRIQGKLDVDWFDSLEALGQRALPVVVRLLSDKDRTTRGLAAGSLPKMIGNPPEEKAFRALLRSALEDPDAEVVLAAAEALARIGDPRAVPTLKEVSYRDSRVVWILAKLGKPAGKALVEYYRTSQHVLGRGDAWYTCAPEFEPEIERGLADPSPYVAVKVTGCLPRLLGKQRGSEMLQRLLGNPRPEVRVQAAQELGKLGDASGLEVAKAVLFDYSLPEDARARAAWAVGQIGGKAVAPLLRTVREADPSGSVRTEAGRAISVMK